MFFLSTHCRHARSLDDHQRCADGALIYCPCWCHTSGGRTVRICDNCGAKPASNKKHSHGFRMCHSCEVGHVVDRGVIVPRELAAASR